MLMYNLIEYSDNHSYTSGVLWLFKWIEVSVYNANVTKNNSTLFDYKLTLAGVTEADDANGRVTNTKIAVPIKYLSNFWRSLEMS